jgi:hypothetical protein
MSKHRVLRTKAWASRWKTPLMLGGAAGVLLLINARRASAGESNASGLFPSSGNAATQLPIQSGTQHIPELPGSGALTSGQFQEARGLWDSLIPVMPLDSGYINFPSGSQAAATLFTTKMDGMGNYYVQWAGRTFQLGNQDATGNWPAIAVG